MKALPKSIIERPELNLRQGIKSSLSNIRAVVSLLYLLYVANDKKAYIEYSDESKSGGVAFIKMKPSLSATIISMLPSITESTLNNLPLFKSQMEALQVGIELFLKLGKVSFNDGLSSSIERTGGNRYNKNIRFGTNIKLIDIYLTSLSDSDKHGLLTAWLQNNSYSNTTIEGAIIRMLTVFTEETQFKIRNSGSEVIFQQEGIYNELNLGNTVESNDEKEQVGPYRVYKSYVREGLHPFISDSSGQFDIKPSIKDEFEEYAQLVSNSLSLIPKRTIVTQIETADGYIEENETIDKIPNNVQQCIYYGAPGTGKSHTIKEDTSDSENKITTTFHPDTDYASFVGCYKPQVEDDGKTITYKFTPQAFANAYVKAWKLLLGGKLDISSLDIKEEYSKWLPNNGVKSINQYNNCINGVKHDGYESGFDIIDPAVIETIIIEKYSGEDLLKSDQDKRSHLKKYKAFLEWLSARSENASEDKNFYLIIEEINRGNCAQIFGDLFQLLDRNEDGYSDYVIDVDKDFTEFLINELVGLDGYKEQICKLAKIENIDNFSFSKIALPCNLSILATMNTSDQSLFPMDSAFKRRWDWEYVPIKPNEVKDVMIHIGENKYSWSDFITKVNLKIAKAHDSEDKQLGQYFVKAKTEMVDGKEIKYISEEQFVSKVMFYLWYEVFKDEVNNTIFITKEKKEGNEDFKSTAFSFNKLFLVDTDEKKSKIDRVMLERFFADSLEMKPRPESVSQNNEQVATESVS